MISMNTHLLVDPTELHTCYPHLLTLQTHLSPHSWHRSIQKVRDNIHHTLPWTNQFSLSKGYTGKIVHCNEQFTFKKFAFAPSSTMETTTTPFHIHAVKCSFINVGKHPLLHIDIETKLYHTHGLVQVTGVTVVQPGEFVADQKKQQNHGHAIIYPCEEDYGQSLHIYNYGCDTESKNSNLLVFEQNERTAEFSKRIRECFEKGMKFELGQGMDLQMRYTSSI